MLKSFFDKLFEETVFLILLILLGISFFFRIPSIGAIDWRVIAALWNLMAVAIAFENQLFLDWIANRISTRFHNERKLAWALIATAMGLSMFMTNDVALLTLVPITIVIGKKGNFDPFKLAVFETIAANIGSSLTPFGNPQNIFLFNQYGMDVVGFITMTIPFVAVSGIGLWLATFTCPSDRIEFDLESVQIRSKGKLYVYMVLFVLAILSIIHVLPWQIVTIVVLGTMILLEWRLLFQIDYFLLGTFICFFLLVDNLLAVPGLWEMISGYLRDPVSVMWLAALSSQIISNVPSAILFQPFVAEVRPLLIGVSLGGMGTMIASLANLISWKIYTKSFPKQDYFLYFTKLNVLLFISTGVMMSFMLKCLL